MASGGLMRVPADAATMMMTRGADVHQADYDREVTRRDREQDTRRQEKVCYQGEIHASQSLHVANMLPWHQQFDSSILASKNMPKPKAEKTSVLRTVIGRYVWHATHRNHVCNLKR